MIIFTAMPALRHERRRDRLRTRWIHHPLKTEKGEASGDVAVVEVMDSISVAAGQGKHAQTAAGHLLNGIARLRLVERDEFAATSSAVVALESPARRRLYCK